MKKNETKNKTPRNDISQCFHSLSLSLSPLLHFPATSSPSSALAKAGSVNAAECRAWE